jgi:hypothetical protein
MYPIDAKTVYAEAHTGTTGTLLTSANNVRTVLSASQNCNTNKDNEIVTNTSVVLDSEGSADFVFVNQQLVIPANETFTWNKTLTGDRCVFRMTYVDRDISVPVVASSTATTTAISTTFTGGESFIILILLMFFVAYFFNTLKQWIFGTKIQGTVKYKYEK